MVRFWNVDTSSYPYFEPMNGYVKQIFVVWLFRDVSRISAYFCRLFLCFPEVYFSFRILRSSREQKLVLETHNFCLTAIFNHVSEYFFRVILFSCKAMLTEIGWEFRPIYLANGPIFSAMVCASAENWPICFQRKLADRSTWTRC